MRFTRTRLVAVAAALSTIAIAAPLSTASAATATPAVAPVAIVSAGPDGSPPVTLSSPGQAGTVTGAHVRHHRLGHLRRHHYRDVFR
jgi:hypothetical protein